MNKIPTPQAFKLLVPSYKKKNVYLSEIRDGAKVSTSSYWDGGSRTYYSVIRLDGGRVVENISPPTGSYPSFSAHYELRPGDVLLSSGVFMGKPSTGTITYQAGDKEKVAEYFGLSL